jgi:hypothetical protein
MSVFADVEAFAEEHRGCGVTYADAGEPTPAGYRVLLWCSCGARLVRWVTPEEAERDLRSAGLA